MRRLAGPPMLAIAAVIAGLAGLVVTSAVAVVAGAESYAVFAVFWSALYLIVGCLFGVQQEIARGVTAPGPRRHSPAPRRSS